MDIYSILAEKQKALQHYGLPTAAKFSLDEINTLSDLNLLRAFKLTYSFPKNFERSTDIMDCTKRIVNGDDVYRVLEFCVLKNKVLRIPVFSIFPRLGECNDS